MKEKDGVSVLLLNSIKDIKSAKQVTINTAKYISGIYTLKVSVEGKTLTSKFIITH